MGSFAGHALPGSFFIGFGLWGAISQFYRYFTCMRRKVPFKSTPTYPISCGRFNFTLIEPVLKITVVIIGIVGEMYTGYNRDDKRFSPPGNAQHSTMFLVFGISGVIDILVHYKAKIPKDLDYAILLLALGVEGLLFHFHLHDRSVLDIRLHTLLIYAIVFNILGMVLEMKYRHNLLAALCRSYGFTVQGTWFWQVGLILYSPLPNVQPWKPHDHFELMMVTMYFTWHYVVVFLIMLAIGCIVACFHRHCYHSNRMDTSAMESLIKTERNDENGISILEATEDSNL